MNNLYIQRSRTVAYRRLGDGIIVMTSTDSTLFDLNEVAALIWESADGRTPLSDIAHSICEQFDVEPEIALRDAQGFVDKLAQKGLLILAQEPIHPAAASAPVTVP